VTDTLERTIEEDDLDASLFADEEVAAEDIPREDDRCQWIDDDGNPCTILLPAGHHPTRKWCDGHKRGGYLHKTTKADKPPINVKINIPKATAPKVDAVHKRVEEAATAWLGLVAAMLEMSGDEVCAGAVKQCAPQIALNLATLSKFHPIIAKVLAPVEASGEVLAWVGLVVAISPVLITILTHHKLLSEEWGTRIGVVAAMGAVVGTAPVPSADE
jgi:hypothetical protein